MSINTKEMKKLILVVVAAATIGGLGLYGGKVTGLLNNDVVYTAPERIVETQTIVEKELDVRIKEAHDAAQPTIEAEAKAMYDKAVAEAKAASEKFTQDEYDAVSDKVKADYIAEIEATIKDPAY
jgi:hypothetical protein